MAKTINEQVESLQNENLRLKFLEKLFEKAVKNEFDMNVKTLHKLIDNKHKTNDFESQIINYFSLKTSQDFIDFLEIFCTEKCLHYFNSQR